MRIFSRRLLAFSLVALVGSQSTRVSVAQSTDQLFKQAVAGAERQEERLVELRHDIHRHPELSGEEERTAGLVAERLTELGFDVRTGVGGHGVVGILEGGRPGPMVAFRADMDAVLSNDPDPVEYRSVLPGVRHICGHDVHTAIGVGLAEAFASIRDELAGSVMLLFQPAEERGIGANAMLGDGVFDRHSPDAIYAFHTAPFNTGEVATVAGGMMAGRARLSVALRGRGDVAAAVSSVRAAVERVGTFRSNNPAQQAPKGFIMVQLFPDRGVQEPTGEAVVRGQIMTAGPADRDRAQKAVTAAIEALDLDGISVEIDYDKRFLDGVTNDTTLVERSNAAIASMAPDVTVHEVTGIVPFFSEDFGSFQERAPGVMYFIGVNNPEAGTVGMPHSPGYVADDSAILVGVRVMVAAMLDRLAGQ